MDIRRLAIKGFLSYREAEIDFTGLDMACISGHNGAGKSSLLDAMTWALFGQARRKDDAIINNQSDAASITIEFEYEGCLYQVQRTKKKDRPVSLELRIQNGGKWKAITEPTVRQTEDRIQAILKMDYETFVNSAFFMQGKADQFTQQRPSDRKRILANVLGLDTWETYREIAAARRRGLETDLSGINARLQEILTELEEEPIRIRRMQESEQTVAALTEAREQRESRVAQLRQSADLIQQKRQMVQDAGQERERLKARRSEVEGSLRECQEESDQYAAIIGREEEIRAVYARWMLARQKMADLDAVSENFYKLRTDRVEIAGRIRQAEISLQQEVERLTGRWAEVALTQERLAGALETREEKQRWLGELNDEIAQIPELEGEIERLRQSNAEAKAENPRLKDEMAGLKSRIEQLSQLSGDEVPCPFCNQPLSADGRTILVEELSAQGKQFGDRYRANVQLMETTATAMQDCESRLKALREKERLARGLSQEIALLSAQIEGMQEVVKGWLEGEAQRLEEARKQLETEDYSLEDWKLLSQLEQQMTSTGYDVEAHAQARQEESETRYVEADTRTLEMAKAAIAPLTREIAGLQTQITDLDADIAAKDGAYARLFSKLAEMEENAPDMAEEERQLTDARERESHAILELGAAKQKVEVLDILRGRAAKMNDQTLAIGGEIGMLQQLEKAFGRDGIPALLIEQALPMIEAKANEILDGLSGGTMSVKFITQKEFRDKKREDLKETLDILISDANGEREYETFSGGEAFRVNFAIRLALSEILAQRAGARLKTLVIDEGFGSQDENGRQRLVEAINAVAGKFSKILVVTHIDAVKDAFPNRIEVAKGPDGSTVSVF